MPFDLAARIQQIVLAAPGFMLAITVHEFTHGYIANRLGDPTAKLAGRLTFNPISHLDPFGTLALVLTGFIGWAKPVPVNPRYFQHPKSDMMWVSLGGPASNLLMALALAAILHFLLYILTPETVNTGSVVFKPLLWILVIGVQINVALAIFNIIPIPPLDGSKILQGLLPPRQAYAIEQLEPYGFIILIVALMSGLLDYVIFPPMRLIVSLLLPS